MVALWLVEYRGGKNRGAKVVEVWDLPKGGR